MSAKPSLTQQIAAAWLGHDVLTGQRGPSAKERAYAAPHAEAAARTLEWIAKRDAAIKRVDDALALLARARIVTSGSPLGDDIRRFLAEVDGGPRS
ncbi:MAG TPA: hypothetical protein VIG36_11235 [Methylocystis sp.]|jgi:hypothetical protein